MEGCDRGALYTYKIFKEVEPTAYFQWGGGGGRAVKDGR